MVILESHLGKNTIYGWEKIFLRWSRWLEILCRKPSKNYQIIVLLSLFIKNRQLALVRNASLYLKCFFLASEYWENHNKAMMVFLNFKYSLISLMDYILVQISHVKLRKLTDQTIVILCLYYIALLFIYYCCRYLKRFNMFYFSNKKLYLNMIF